MKPRVLFLDEDTQVCRAYAELLRLKNFELVFDIDTEPFPKLMDSIDLVVFGAPNSPRRVDFCTRALKEYPRLPHIYILTNDTPFLSEAPLDELHVHIRPLSAKKLFLNSVESLLRIKGIENSLKSGQRVQIDVTDNSLSGFYDSLDLGVVVGKTLKFFASKLKADNLHWIEVGEFERSIVSRISDGETPPITRLVTFRSYSESDTKTSVKKLRRVMSSSKLMQFQNGICGVESRGKKYDLVVPVGDESGQVLAYLFFEKVKDDDISMLVEMVSKSLELMVRHIGFSVQYWQAQNRAFIDDLTDLYNQRYLPLVLDNEIARANRQGLKFAVLFIDVDYFKTVNDTRGHWIGSQTLIELGKLIKDKVRTTDYAFRYGGDEFVLILTNTDPKSSEMVAERIRRDIEQTTFKIDEIELNVTVSIGLAVYPDHARTSEQIIQMADQAMYYGKHKSRNIVYMAS